MNITIFAITIRAASLKVIIMRSQKEILQTALYDGGRNVNSFDKPGVFFAEYLQKRRFV